MAENIDGQLKRMVQDLKDIIGHLNANNSSQDSNDPVHQIAKILNAHMDSLQWVDQNSGTYNDVLPTLASSLQAILSEHSILNEL